MKFRLMRVKASSVLAAMTRGELVSSDWQAQYIEVALLPAINQRWQEANRDRFESLTITRIEGIPHIGYTPDQNRAVKDWTVFAGYTLTYGVGRWNSVCPDWFSHSPSVTWDGMRRETIHQFVYDLGVVARLLRDKHTPQPINLETLQRYAIEVVDDLPDVLEAQASQLSLFAPASVSCPLGE